MGLHRRKIRDFVEQIKIKCGIPNLTPDEVSGVNSNKDFFEPSNQVGADTSSYKVVPDGCFACNLMHVGRDVVLPIAWNTSGHQKVVSPAYSVFLFDGGDALLPEYFMIYLKSSEKDRFFWFNTDSSVRDGMSWDDFVDMEIEFPDIDIQRKYAEIYKAMQANQRCYEQGLDDLKLTCDAFVEELMRDYPHVNIAPFVKRHDVRNSDNSIRNVKGVSTSKCFREPTSKVNRDELSGYKIVKPRQFSFVQTTHNEKVFAYALNLSNEDIVVTSVNEVFSVDETKIIPEYLALFFNRTEFDRYARFHSWGSARETFTWDDLNEVSIPIPTIEIQTSISDIFTVLQSRKSINERLKARLKDICPILIKGSIEEARLSQ